MPSAARGGRAARHTHPRAAVSWRVPAASSCATMKLLGDWNWYLPKWLEWLPRVSRDAPAPTPAPARPAPPKPVAT
jgi:hypothetical protein